MYKYVQIMYKYGCTSMSKLCKSMAKWCTSISWILRKTCLDTPSGNLCEARIKLYELRNIYKLDELRRALLIPAYRPTLDRSGPTTAVKAMEPARKVCVLPVVNSEAWEFMAWYIFWKLPTVIDLPGKLSVCKSKCLKVCIIRTGIFGVLIRLW